MLCVYAQHCLICFSSSVSVWILSCFLLLCYIDQLIEYTLSCSFCTCTYLFDILILLCICYDCVDDGHIVQVKMKFLFCSVRVIAGDDFVIQHVSATFCHTYMLFCI